MDRLSSTLSELGLVVEGVEHVGAGLGDVVVASVTSIRPHPKHDTNRLVEVDAGGDETVEVICGAWNFVEGDLVPLAPISAVLPGGFEISRRKMRGEWSNGMLCSAEELGLAAGAGGADGLLVLPAGTAPPGTPLLDALGIEADVVFDIDIAQTARMLCAWRGSPVTSPRSSVRRGRCRNRSRSPWTCPWPGERRVGIG